MTEAARWTAFVKAQDTINGPPRPSFAWARARRTHMKIYQDRTEIGDWVLPHADVTHAHLYQTTRVLKNRMLEIATPQRTVQINFNPGTTPEGHLPYEIQIRPFPPYLARFRVVFWVVMALAFCLIVFT